MIISKSDLDKKRENTRIDGIEYCIYKDTKADLDTIGEGNYRLVGFEEVGFAVKIPLVTFETQYCSSTALNKGRKFGFNHCPPSPDKDDFVKTYPSRHIRKTAENMHVKLDKDVNAIINAAEDLETVLNYLKRKKVNIKGWYREEDYYKSELSQRGGLVACPRDMIVIPSTKEVFIYTHKGRIDMKF